MPCKWRSLYSGRDVGVVGDLETPMRSVPLLEVVGIWSRALAFVRELALPISSKGTNGEDSTA